MRFFLDHNVPTEMADALKLLGHQVLIQKDVIAPDSSDPIVALASALNDAILISFDSDHNSIAHRHGITNRRLKKLSRIHMRCDFVGSGKRITEAMSFIEHEWELSQQASDPRMFIEILGYGLKTLR